MSSKKKSKNKVNKTVPAKPPKEDRPVNLVPPLEELPEANNFWNTCVLALDELPTSPCHMGKPEKSAEGRVIKEPGCPWWIDSEQHQYCFWRWVQTQSICEGKMDPLPQNEIAKLFGCSSTKIHFVVKESIQKLQENGFSNVLTEFLYSDSDPDGESFSIYNIPFDEPSEE